MQSFCMAADQGSDHGAAVSATGSLAVTLMSVNLKAYSINDSLNDTDNQR